MASKVIWSVSYYVPGERLWQFAGEGSRDWAQDRAALLSARGHETRIRWRHDMTGQAAILGIEAPAK